MYTYFSILQLKALTLLDRMSLSCPELTRTQLEAVARTALASKVSCLICGVLLARCTFI